MQLVVYSKLNKDMKINIKKRILNKSRISELKTYIRKFLNSLLNKNYESSLLSYRIVVSKSDKMVSKGIIHKNKSSRLKKRLNIKLSSIKQN